MGNTWWRVRRFLGCIKNDRWGGRERGMAHFLAVPHLAAHCGQTYLLQDVGGFCSSKTRSAGSWVCGIMLDISYACMMVGSPARESCFRSAFSNTLKKRYWTLAMTASMCSSAVHHTCMSCTNCLAYAKAVVVIYPSTTGGAIPACISPCS